MNGLDDLRAWTLRGAIQQHIDVYVSQTTFSEVQRAFPYMVSEEFASGGGDVPEVKWHIFEDGVPIVLEESGIEVLPLPGAFIRLHSYHIRDFVSSAPRPVLYADRAKRLSPDTCCHIAFHTHCAGIAHPRARPCCYTAAFFPALYLPCFSRATHSFVYGGRLAYSR
jgi:hypothetical protein